MVKPCKFDNVHDEMIRNRLDLGCNDKAARARLFRKKDCNLKKAIETLRISESTYEQLTMIDNKNDIKEEIHATRQFRNVIHINEIHTGEWSNKSH